MSASSLRVGIIGAGANSYRHHIPKLQAIDGVEVVAVSNRTRQSGEKAAADWSIPTVHDRWDDLIADDSIDAVVIGTWPSTHCQMTTAALARGQHGLGEARMAMDADQARQMLEAAGKHPGLVAQIVPSPLTLGVDATIVRLLHEGYLGDLLALDVTSHTPDFPAATDVIHWREDRRLSGLNVMTLGIWYESVMRWVGSAESVFAQGKVHFPTRSDGHGGEIKVEIPDHLDVLAEMTGGVQARFQMSRLGSDSTQRAVLMGSKAVIDYRDGQLRTRTRTDGEWSPIDVPPHERSEWRVEESFVGAIRGEEEVRLTDFPTGVKYMEFTEAVWRSMSEGRTIPLA